TMVGTPYEEGLSVQADAHLPFGDVLKRAESAEKVTFVGEVANFRSQIEASLPHAQIMETLPSALGIGRLGRDLPAVNVDA
ncbi:tRNA (adenosine(37)-N6)-threonylcarbamoyltransferase complex dimerization subunit type 1 TsaB, partial [Streptococcus pyogenes]